MFGWQFRGTLKERLLALRSSAVTVGLLLVLSVIVGQIWHNRPWIDRGARAVVRALGVVQSSIVPTAHWAPAGVAALKNSKRNGPLV